jgi:hypothetical protein
MATIHAFTVTGGGDLTWKIEGRDFTVVVGLSTISGISLVGWQVLHNYSTHQLTICHPAP